MFGFFGSFAFGSAIFAVMTEHKIHFFPVLLFSFCHMRIVYQNGIAYKVDSFGRLVRSKTRPYGSGRFHGADTTVLRVPVSLVPAIRRFIIESLDSDSTDYSNYTTPGFENAEVYDE